MKKKKKQKFLIMSLIFAFIFPIIVKVLNLDSNQIGMCISFYGIVLAFYSNFRFGEALQPKLSVIT
ncbi:MAG: hypothetical protein PHX03_05655 [Bacilli bacterium]|nr:hypothetical protein [Bacilli bacterium]